MCHAFEHGENQIHPSTGEIKGSADRVTLIVHVDLCTRRCHMSGGHRPMSSLLCCRRGLNRGQFST